jgi:filamentous hemagglutinin family protein
MWRAKFTPILFSAISLVGFSGSTALAQTVPDNTLGSESSTVNQDVTMGDTLVDLIEDGAIRGNNLFHSFSEFNVGDGSAVYFANPDGIANILTRVTGNNLSEIFGTLGVDGAANLFLLNPNGIVFGENAALDLNGSFLATTADSYIFENGFEYNARNPTKPPLLTVNIPVGLQFGFNSGDILAHGNNGLQEEEYSEQLYLSSPQTLGLVGGNIFLEGSNIQNPGGRIELGSVAQPGLVGISPTSDGFTLGYEDIENFGNIYLTQFSQVITTSEGSGNIQIQAKNLSLENNSAILANTLGDEPGGQFQVRATDSIKIIADDSNDSLGGLSSVVESEAKGKGGNLNIETGHLILQNGAAIAVTTFGKGNAGSLTIRAEEIELIGTDVYQTSSSGLFTDTQPESTGKGGDLFIDTQRLSVRDGAAIATGTSGVGDGGFFNLKAEEVELVGTSVNGEFASGLFTDTQPESIGKGGDLYIDTQRLSVRDGAAIATGTSGVGDGGFFNLKAEEVELVGTSVNGEFASGLFTDNQPESTGKGGDFYIDTESLSLRDGGAIATGTSGVGDGGSLNIKAKEIELNGKLNRGLYATGLSTSAFAGNGKAGNLNLEAENLRIVDGGQILSSSFGNNEAGNINIMAKSLEVSGIDANGKFISTIASTSSSDFSAGSANILTDNLTVRDKGQISVSNFGKGNAGNLNITSGDLNLDNSATLAATVNAGSQGNINLTTDNIFLSNNSEITAKATGKATGGNITINNTDNIVLLENSQIIADAEEGNGGNIDIITQGLFVSPESRITASSELGLDGNVKLESINGDRSLELDQLPDNLVDRTQQIAKSCGVGTNQFAIAGRGGLPENPWQNLRGQTVWQDLRLTVIDSNNTSQVQAEQPSTLVLEAQAWKINDQGQIELIAIGADARRLINQAGCQ